MRIRRLDPAAGWGDRAVAATQGVGVGVIGPCWRWWGAVMQRCVHEGLSALLVLCGRAGPRCLV